MFASLEANAPEKVGVIYHEVFHFQQHEHNSRAYKVFKEV